MISVAAIALAAISLIVLFVALQAAEPREMPIASVQYAQENELVAVSGIVKTIEDK